MRVHVVSDVHGNAEALARAGDGADALLVLGDLVDFVDYHDPHRGILGRVLGPEVSRRFGEIRTNGRPGELREFARTAWAAVDDPPAVVADAVREQYAELFAAMSAPTWAIAGNVDLPELWPEFVRDGVVAAEGRVVELGGLRFGFVGGAPLPVGAEPRRGGPWRPNLLPAGEFDARVAAVGPVDVLCSHVPPAVPELAYDVVSRSAEASSVALLDRCRTDRPRAALFGHVHQPLAARARVGRTECVNVGYFRRTGVPYVLRW
ncbi:metallophosphoesterase family protein [Pseudonocardia hydrocarbonoxydans]|uniref:Metallophosphoesterase n=1 Tax=Pseudonocardia hydrocarbonoxydans TaxID=76726 RepID=A0A4Y3WIJ9_9PSEU|nr:metallophosphoesterase [Pseudonocardia hydrocarbonoxydans]GEC18604.1 metallophosphoesterase [Pseudonocardia hydrocarbonoxydans]